MMKKCMFCGKEFEGTKYSYRCVECIGDTSRFEKKVDETSDKPNPEIKPGKMLSDFGYKYVGNYQNYELVSKQTGSYIFRIAEYRELNAENSGED